MKSSRLPRSSPAQIRQWRRRAAKAQEDRAREKYDHKYRRIGSNRERKAKKRERDFGDKAAFVRDLPCLVCGVTLCDPHHYPSRGAGGTSKDMVALCRKHHRQFHRMGAKTFQETYNVDLLSESRRVEREWRER